MKLSLTEAKALAISAARGAGAPPGQAQSFGGALVAHLAADRDPALLTGALAELPNGPILDLPILLSRATEDAHRADEGPRAIRHAAQPLLLSYVDANPRLQIADTDPLEIEIAAAPKAQAQPARLAMPEDLFVQLKALAAKTLVPETAASRQSGAGAGLTDND